MKCFKHLFFLFLCTTILLSCQKEYSVENGGSGGGGTTGTNCKISQLVETNKTTGTSEYAYISTYDAAHKVTQIDLVDSVRGTLDNSFPITYPSGKIQVDADQYFLVGTDGKVTEFHGHEFPDDNTSEMFTVKYSYNTTGQIVKRTEEYDTLPGVVTFQMEFVYTGNNLTREDIKYNFGTTLVKVGEILYEYDASKTIKNFLFLHAVTPEILYFQTAINAGPAATNPLTKATVNVLDITTGNITTTVTTLSNYTIDANSYVKSFEVSGDDFDVAGLFSGKKYLLNYSCF